MFTNNQQLILSFIHILNKYYLSSCAALNMKFPKQCFGFLSQLGNVFKVSTSKATNDKKPGNVIQDPANFETAIEATGFGKFNMLLLIISIPSGMACIFASTSVAYVIPIAECDLELSLEDKGMLNAITYLGMITSGFFWGYLTDTIGRKKLLVAGYLLNGSFVILSGFSQVYIMLLVTKFFEGFIINGPFAALISYLNEFHCAKYRSYLPSIQGIINSSASVMLPLLGWLILTKLIHISIADFLVLKSWNIFLLASSIPSLTAGFSIMLLPESPKFQMTIGNNKLAYKTFQKIYSWNTGSCPNTYPIKSLVHEMDFTESTEYLSKSNMQTIKDGWKQLLPLFRFPYGGKIMLLSLIEICFLLGLNTLKLWLPQLFQAIASYQELHKLHAHNINRNATLCTMIEILHPTTILKNETCVVDYSIDAAYQNNIIVGMASVVCYLGAAPFSALLGKKLTLVLSATIGGISGICLYFAQDETFAVALASACIGFTGVAQSMLLSIVVDIFPTTLRTMTVALTMATGRCGAMTGNLIFPMLLTAGCLPPFITVGGLIIGGTVLSFALPRTDQKGLE